MTAPTTIQDRETQLAEVGVVFLTKSLPPHELEEHKADLGVELEVMSCKLDRFGWGAMDPYIRARLRADWANALANYTVDEVKLACKKALGGKASEALNEERIKAIIESRRSEIVKALPKPVGPERPIHTTNDAQKARADELVASIGRGLRA